MISSIPKASQDHRFFSLRNLVLIGAGTLLLAAIYAHIQINGNPDYAGPLAVLDRIFDIALATALSGLLVCLGHAFLKRFRLNFASTAESISFSLFLGAGIVGLSLLCLGLFGLLRPWPVTMLLAVYITLTARHLPELSKLIKEAIRSALITRETRVVALLILTLLAVLILRAATPPNAADELIYHLPVTKQFVQQGRIYPVYDNSLGNLPFLLHMIYALCLMAGSDIAARLFSLFVAVATALALYAFCSRFLTRRVGVIAMFAFFSAGMVVEVAVTVRVDVSLAGMVFVATYAMINYLVTRHRKWLWVSSVFAGFSLGIKHSAGLWLLLVGVMYLIENFIRKDKDWLTPLKLGIAYTAIAAAIASPWYIKNYVWFYNPLYPLFTGEVAEFGPQGFRYFNEDDEHKLDAHFDVAQKEMPEIVKAQEDELSKAIHSRPERHPMRFWAYYTEPHTYLMDEPYHYPNYLFLLIPFLVFLRRKRWVVWLLGVSVGFFLLVTSSSWIARHLLPLYPPLTIVAAYTLIALCDRFGGRFRFFRNLHIYAIAAGMGTFVAAFAFSMREFNSLGFLLGTLSRHEAMLSQPYFQPIDYINDELPATSRVLIIGAQRTYGLERYHLTDESWFATKWRRLLVHNDSLEAVNQDLKRQGFSHIFFSPDLFKFAAQMGLQGAGGMELIAGEQNKHPEQARALGREYQLLRNWSTFTLYQSKFLEPVYADNHKFRIFKIK